MKRDKRRVKVKLKNGQIGEVFAYELKGDLKEYAKKEDKTTYETKEDKTTQERKKPGRKPKE